MNEKGIFSVTQINEYLRMLMDGDRVLSGVFVRGEISNFKLYSSGHAYFTLKDEEGQLRAVMFRSYASRLLFAPADGMRVIVHGRISVYGASGQYQLYADEMQPDGAGSLALRYEQLKRKLEAEGLFDPARKRPLPPMPRRIGVITSPTGAAIHDMMNILGRRFPCAQMILFPSLVQGAEAPAQLILGLEFFGMTRLVDVIILGRGGGSAEDLWAFNDEALARAVAACPIPVISAVGHESDFTICDFVADQRAPTPSAAAELAVPDKKDLLLQLHGVGERMRTLMERRLAQERQDLQRLSEARVLTRPQCLLDPFSMRLSQREEALDRWQKQRTQSERLRLSALCGKLESLNPLAVLARGYAAVTRPDGESLMRAADTTVGERIEIQFADGSVRALVESKKG
ncbi:MAG: exodeoxyribonuclease VII large subunit [Clostridia bacterium]|nr:exodeoxyribonuclease VII large subunit [Clostridia bacterium]